METQPRLEQQRLLDTWQHTLAQQSDKHSNKAMRQLASLALTVPLMVGGPLFAAVWAAPSLWWANVAIGFGIASVFAPFASLLGFAKSASKQGHVDWLQGVLRQTQWKLKPQLAQAEQEVVAIAQEAQKPFLLHLAITRHRLYHPLLKPLVKVSNLHRLYLPIRSLRLFP